MQKLTEIEVSNIVYCMVMAKFSITTTYKNMGVPDFMEGSLISYKIGDSGPLFHIKMWTRGPRGPNFHLTPVRQSHSSPASLRWQGIWSERNAQKRTQEPPEHTSEHVKFPEGVLPHCPHTIHLCGPTFCICPWPPNPLGDPQYDIWIDQLTSCQVHLYLLAKVLLCVFTCY